MNVTKSPACFVTLACAALLCLGAALAFCPAAWALPGSVYRGTLERCYEHPVTGVIEDAGGEAGAATGQGMVEGCLSNKCMLEVADGGQYFLTVRLGLVDYTKNRDFTVQKWGAKGWRKTRFAVVEKTKMNGDAALDYCIRVPSQKCIVRITMFVKPIGREVVGYFYPTRLKLGTPAGMTPKIVTEKSKEGAGKKKLETGGRKSQKGDSGAGSKTAAEAGSPEAGAVVGSAHGLTLSVGSDAGGAQQAAAQAGLEIPSPSSWGPVVWAIVAFAAAALVVACLAIALHRRRARRARADSDDYSRAYAEEAAGERPHETGGAR